MGMSFIMEGTIISKIMQVMDLGVAMLDDLKKYYMKRKRVDR